MILHQKKSVFRIFFSLYMKQTFFSLQDPLKLLCDCMLYHMIVYVLWCSALCLCLLKVCDTNLNFVMDWLLQLPWVCNCDKVYIGYRQKERRNECVESFLIIFFFCSNNGGHCICFAHCVNTVLALKHSHWRNN